MDVEFILESVQLSSQNIYVNYRNVSREKPFKCRLCRKPFADLDDLKIHDLFCTENKPYKCQVCLDSFSENFVLHCHEKIHVADSQRTLPSDPQALAQTKNLAHEKVHAAEKQCRFQSDPPALVQTKNLKTHENVQAAQKEPRLLPCPQAFAQSTNLPTQKETSTSEKQYKCQLPAGGRTEERPGSCERCGEVMPDTDDRSQKRKKEKFTESQTKQKPIKCLFCDRSFDSVYLLKIHVRIHAGKKPYIKCFFCNRSFDSIPLLKTHVQIHAGKKPYSCHVCGEAFVLESLLNAHVTNHALMSHSADRFSESSSQNAADMATNVTKCAKTDVVKNKVCVNCTTRKYALGCSRRPCLCDKERKEDLVVNSE